MLAASDASSLLGVIVDPGLLGLQRGDEELFDCLHHFGVRRHIVGDHRSACDARVEAEDLLVLSVWLYP